MVRLIVDGMNVVGSRGDGWWEDRDAAVMRLIRMIAEAEALGGEEVTVVLDGRLPPGLGKTTRAGIAVIESRRRGRNAADHRIVELLADDPRPWEVTVITSDRALRDRVRSLGAKVIGSGSFLRLLDGRSRGPGQ